MTIRRPWLVLLLLASSSACETTYFAPSEASRGVEPPSAPRPAGHEELMRGFVDTVSREDVDAARTYFLSPVEYDDLFAWEGAADPRPEWEQAVAAALTDLAAQLRGARFSAMADPASRGETTMKAGVRIGTQTFQREAVVVDEVGAALDVNGAKRTLYLTGLVRVGDHWRLYGPVFRIEP